MPDQIVVIGASAGGVETLRTVVGGLHPRIAAPVVITLHLQPTRSYLVEILARSTSLPVAQASHNSLLRKGHVYVCPPDYHVVVRGHRTFLDHGPKRNGHRPSIDVLFESVATAYGRRAIGVILTGLLYDGGQGLAEITRLGGRAVVQDPSEAAYPDMPANALKATRADFVVPAADVAPLLNELTASPDERAAPTSGGGIVKKSKSKRSAKPPVELTRYTCPDCSGVLAESKKGETKFICRVGHTYSPGALNREQAAAAERALWAALQTLEERVDLQKRLAESTRGSAQKSAARHFEARADETQRHVANLRKMLESRSWGDSD